jgi:hypothetical protein
MLPEDDRYRVKYVISCLEDGVAGELDREALVAALEVFGQMRDSGVNPNDILQKLKERSEKIAPLIKAVNLLPSQNGENKAGRAHMQRKSSKKNGTRKIRKR